MSTAMIWETLSTSSVETERLGELLGQTISGGEVIELTADLGGGKTTFVRGLAKGAGSNDVVSSPTFTLNNIYKSKNLQIHHYDFYRLENPGILKKQLLESLDNPNTVTVVEWSQIAQDALPSDRLTIKFSPTANNPDERKISIKYPASWSNLTKKLKTNWAGIRP